MVKIYKANALTRIFLTLLICSKLVMAQTEVSAERALNATLQGGCSVAIGAFATSEDSKLTLSGMVGNVDSGEIIRVQETGETSKPIDLGIRAAKKLLSLGARELLNEK